MDEKCFDRIVLMMGERHLMISIPKDLMEDPIAQLARRHLHGGPCFLRSLHDIDLFDVTFDTESLAVILDKSTIGVALRPA